MFGLTTGKHALITATGSGKRDAAIARLGLVYADDAYQVPHGARQHGKLVFVPTAQLLALVS